MSFIPSCLEDCRISCSHRNNRGDGCTEPLFFLLKLPILLALPPVVSSCDITASFNANRSQCAVLLSGYVECRYDESTELIINSEDTACIRLNDGSQRLISTLKISVNPRYDCNPKTMVHKDSRHTHYLIASLPRNGKLQWNNMC
uniref:DUF3019 domain-containing protein n=1 Tax=Heterorhabditis bacteriophora TaxID=37862 RepID=A0A1I7WV86_HETBA